MSAIPSWLNGIIPPIREGGNATSTDRSPYSAELSEFVQRFATSKERCILLDGFLNFRKGLHDAGIKSGFQWINGSFVENVEETRKRSPHDIDVVTFYAVPAGENQQQLLDKMGDLCDQEYCSKKFSVDSYYQALGDPLDDSLVKWVSYWYSMWSHRRENFEWKGFVQISLDPSLDDDSRNILESIRSELQ